MTTTKTNQKPLKEIIDNLRQEALENQKYWEDGLSYGMVDVPPPDITAITDQFSTISDLAADTHLPMLLLYRIATTLSTSENTPECAIGHTLLTCHREILQLTEFCSKLSSMKVGYPCKDATESEEE